jgi:SAM-dependent methyltransferase
MVSPDDPGEWGWKTPRLSVTPSEERVLALIAEGCRVLEIGTGLGISTKALATGAREVVTVDIDPWVAANIAPSLPENVRFLSALPDPTEEKFDLVFIDGCHIAEALRVDLKEAKQRLYPRGIIVLHDTQYDHVRSVVNEVVHYSFFINSEHGIGIIWQPIW